MARSAKAKNNEIDEPLEKKLWKAAQAASFDAKIFSDTMRGSEGKH
jgi:hypothetical protein